MFYRKILQMQTDVLNMKQHFVARAMPYITSVRRGSFTVCPGFQKGADIEGGIVQPADETLRWSDITFVKPEAFAGITVQIAFRFRRAIATHTSVSLCWATRSSCSSQRRETTANWTLQHSLLLLARTMAFSTLRSSPL